MRTKLRWIEIQRYFKSSLTGLLQSPVRDDLILPVNSFTGH